MKPLQPSAIATGRQAESSERVSRLWPGSGSAWSALAWYVLAAVAMTWPLAAHVATRLPHDLGDPLEVCWILWWGADHAVRLLSGQFDAFHRFWDANIFYPHPLTLAYAEHLIPQALQILPVFALTRNLVLCYNLLFLSTFVLSGLGMFLLVRALTGNPRAAFLAGLFYAFTPYRLAQVGHVQVLSSQWMPFVLLGMRRFFEARGARQAARAGAAALPEPVTAAGRLAGVRPLAWGMVAFAVQNLSCGYFLVYFAPFLLAYSLWELVRRRLWRDAGTWALLASGAGAAMAITVPFLLPYLGIRRLGFGVRPLDEVTAFSADTFCYLRAADTLWLWPGGFTWVGRPEGTLFPGFTPMIFAVMALAALAVDAWKRTRGHPPLRGWRLAAAVPCLLVGAWAMDLSRFVLFAGRQIGRVRRVWPPLAIASNLFMVAGACLLVLLVLSKRVRDAARTVAASGRGFFAAAFLMAVWLSFGPYVSSASYGVSGETLYAWLYRYVPGFDGVRVPSRFAMLAMMFLAILGGYGAAHFLGRRSSDGSRGRRPAWRSWVVTAAAVFFLVESTAAPFEMVPLEWPRRDFRGGKVSFDDLRPLYGFLRQLPQDAVILELPFGNLEGETRAMLLSTLHRHPIVNGYSGNFPDSYNNLCDVLENPIAHGDPAWYGLLRSRATHIVVHEWGYLGYAGQDLSRWLLDHGARHVATFRADRVFEMPRPEWPAQ